MRFPYQAEALSDPDPITGSGHIYRPIIPIRLIYRHRDSGRFRYRALINSGADWCLFHSEVGELLGIPAREGQPRSFVGVEGIEKTAYFHSVQLVVDSSMVEILAGFIDGFRFPYGLLGQHGFFSHFRVVFERTASAPYVEVTRRDG